MASSHTALVTYPSEREFEITRLLDAPRDLVWEVWTDPTHLVQWFGPDGFSTTTHAFDFRVGGEWRFTMHGPDGVDYTEQAASSRRSSRGSASSTSTPGGSRSEDEGGFVATVTLRRRGIRRPASPSIRRFPDGRRRCGTPSRRTAPSKGGKQHLGRLAALPDAAAGAEDGDPLPDARTPRGTLVWKALDHPRGDDGVVLPEGVHRPARASAGPPGRGALDRWSMRGGDGVEHGRTAGTYLESRRRRAGSSSPGSRSRRRETIVDRGAPVPSP